MNDLGVYLDNNATTAVAPEIIAGLNEILPVPGNASSIEHAHGLNAKRIVDKATQSIKDFFNLKNQLITYTSGSTESANTIIRSYIDEAEQPPKIICSAVEHPCILKTLQYFDERQKCILEIVRVDGKGRLNLDDLKAKAQGAVLGCFMHVNNEIGNIYPIEKIGKILKENDCDFLCDATQSVGKIKFSFTSSKIDYLIFSGHKINALQGIGCIISTKKFTPLLVGGSQQDGLRSGTLNVPGIYSLGKALVLSKGKLEKNLEVVMKTREEVWQEIKAAAPEAEITGDLENQSPYTLHFTIPFIMNLAIIKQLEGKLSISSGSACSAGTVSPSHVLQAMGLGQERIMGAFRLGIISQNSKKDLSTFIQKLFSV
jgi:cysteine desulfurase